MSNACNEPTPISRRHALSLIGAASAAVVTGCSGDADVSLGSPPPPPSPPASPPPPPGSSCTVVAQETAGPFPADGTNNVAEGSGTAANALDDPGIIRSDIRSDTDGSDLQTGVPLSLTIKVQNINNNCAPLPGYYVYVWHVNRTGNYSQYASNANGGDFTANNFLRGVQQTDADGEVSFTTVFPGRYAGRATHIHFAIYPNNQFQANQRVAVSQLAFPADVTDAVYANTALYPQSAANDTSNEEDGIFGDGTSTEMLSISGSPDSGYTASITVTVSA